jgi:hypothetical protein
VSGPALALVECVGFGFGDVGLVCWGGGLWMGSGVSLCLYLCLCLSTLRRPPLPLPQPPDTHTHSHTHRRYGDQHFLHMMWLKTVSGWIVNRLNYDLLYLDSDLIYRKDTEELFKDLDVGAFGRFVVVGVWVWVWVWGCGGCARVFECDIHTERGVYVHDNDPTLALTKQITQSTTHSLTHTPTLTHHHHHHTADIFMQDDGARSERFGPYFGNTGFFFVRANGKTKHLMQVRCSPSCLLVLLSWLVGWWVGRLIGWLVGWLVGWWVAWLARPTNT